MATNKTTAALKSALKSVLKSEACITWNQMEAIVPLSEINNATRGRTDSCQHATRKSQFRVE